MAHLPDGAPIGEYEESEMRQPKKPLPELTIRTRHALARDQRRRQAKATARARVIEDGWAARRVQMQAEARRGEWPYAAATVLLVALLSLIVSQIARQWH